MEHLLSTLTLSAPLGLAAVSGCRSVPTSLRVARFATGLSLVLALFALGAVLVSGSWTSSTLGVGEVGFSLRFDLLSTTMAALVSFVGYLVVRYSRNYLAGDARQADFTGRLCLALAAALLLVLAGNLAQLVVAWVATSFALHRLLVFYEDRPRALIAGRKKMLVARASDFCLLVGVVLLAQGFGTADIATITSRAAEAGASPAGVGVAVWFLVVAAALKSAQFPFHSWLVEVMETPTPVSALLHAGMINAGGFLILRFAPVVVLEPGAMAALVAAGAVTAVVGSLVMVTQTSIKRSLAYSTHAQMGLMMIECGLGAFGVALLHIVGHSLYKAHAFLSAGNAVIEAPRVRSPKPTGRASLYWAAAVGVVAAGLSAVGLTTLIVDPSNPAWNVTAALATVLTLGIAIWVGEQLRERRSSAALATAGSIVLAIPALFFGLKWGVERLYSDVLPVLSAPTVFASLILWSTVVAFAGLAWAQIVGFPSSRSLDRLYVFARNGAYMAARWDRWVGALRVRSTRPLDARGSVEPSAGDYSPSSIARAQEPTGANSRAIDRAIGRAVGAIPPLWPLSDFVAVNPFLGLSDLRFRDASAWLERTAGARTMLPRAFYAAAFDRGEIQRRDLLAAVQESESGITLVEVERGLRRRDRSLAAAPTVADVARGISGFDLPRVVVEHIGDWCETYFDRGQAKWRSPWREESPYAAWRAYARYDRGPEVLGVADVRSVASELPESARAAIGECARRLGLQSEELDLYFQRLLMRIDGWAGHLRYLGWSSELAGEAPSEVADLLAVSLAWELALHEADERVASAWRIAKSELASQTRGNDDFEIDLALHRAFELANQRRIAKRLEGGSLRVPENCTAQVVFCIDVRSERMRRLLETYAPDVRTLGFAGFFGMAIEWIPLGEERGVASCPVLLEPAHAVRETSPDEDRLVSRRRSRRTAARAFDLFKSAAVSSFGFVETLGLAYGPRLITESARRVASTRRPRPADCTHPTLDVGQYAECAVGIPLTDRVDLAEGALRGMSLTRDFAPLVVLTAHGSSTVNNPYASGLDCGACGGRSGEANARVAVTILNDPEVRRGLALRGIDVPDRTRFVAAAHDTTTDVVEICDRESIPQEHRDAVERLEASFALAGSQARRERAPALGVHDGDESKVLTRSVDWSQVRPEWGLAGCTSFIAAPRAHTAGANLGASAFLHEYEWSQDEEFRVLEQIVSAPMVVATWINLQYFASTVDNRAFGAGDKVLHNVVGGLGVLEGNGGDLRVGLPLQSVHDGARFVHSPARLTVAIAAPIEALNTVLARQPRVRQLLDNDWIHLFALSDRGVLSHRYVGDLQWTSTEELSSEEADPEVTRPVEVCELTAWNTMRPDLPSLSTHGGHR